MAASSYTCALDRSGVLQKHLLNYSIWAALQQRAACRTQQVLHAHANITVDRRTAAMVQSTRSLQKRLFKCRIAQLCTQVEIPYAQWARWSPTLFKSNQKVVVNIALIQLSK